MQLLPKVILPKGWCKKALPPGASRSSSTQYFIAAKLRNEADEFSITSQNTAKAYLTLWDKVDFYQPLKVLLKYSSGWTAHNEVLWGYA